MTDSDPQISRGRKRWELDRDALEALLAALASDRDAAGEKYEDLRRRLCNLFAWEQCDAPEDLVDDVLNRLARKIMEGAVIPHLDRFAFGIARLVVQEEIRRRQTRQTAIREFPAAVDKSPDWTARESMQGCLDRLPADRRTLIERYYAEDRAALARDLGVSVNALRNRALRIREDLMRCLSQRRDES